MKWLKAVMWIAALALCVWASFRLGEFFAEKFPDHKDGQSYAEYEQDLIKKHGKDYVDEMHMRVTRELMNQYGGR